MTKFDYEIDDFMTYCSSKNLSKKTMRKNLDKITENLFFKYRQID